MEAALDGSREIGFTILSMTFSLAAVFIPVLFMGGILGRLLHEFAVTIAAAILVSGFVSLTPDADAVQPLSAPARKRAPRPPLPDHRALRSTGCSTATSRSLAVVMTPSARDARARARLIGGAPSICSAVIPKGFLPSEDQGQILMFTKAAQGISFDAMVKHQEAIADIIRRDPNVTTYFSSVGATGSSGGGNTGILFAHLKPRRRAQTQRRPGDRRVAAQARRRSRHHRVPAESAADPDRRASSPKRPTSSRCRARTATNSTSTRTILEAQDARDCAS